MGELLWFLGRVWCLICWGRGWELDLWSIRLWRRRWFWCVCGAIVADFWGEYDCNWWGCWKCSHSMWGVRCLWSNSIQGWFRISGIRYSLALSCDVLGWRRVGGERGVHRCIQCWIHRWWYIRGWVSICGTRGQGWWRIGSIWLRWGVFWGYGFLMIMIVGDHRHLGGFFIKPSHCGRTVEGCIIWWIQRGFWKGRCKHIRDGQEGCWGRSCGFHRWKTWYLWDRGLCWWWFWRFWASHFCADISGVVDAVAANFDASAVGIFFLGADIAKNFVVYYLLASVRWDVVVVGNKESVSERDAFTGSRGVGADALAEASNFVGVGFVP